MYDWDFKTVKDSGTNVLGLIVFCIALGTIIGRMGESGKPLLDFFTALSDAMMLITKVVVWWVSILLRAPITITVRVLWAGRLVGEINKITTRLKTQRGSRTNEIFATNETTELEKAIITQTSLQDPGLMQKWRHNARPNSRQFPYCFKRLVPNTKRSMSVRT